MRPEPTGRPEKKPIRCRRTTIERGGVVELDQSSPEPKEFNREKLRDRYRVERDKRMRADLDAQFLDIEGDYAEFGDDPYVEAAPAREPLHDEVDVVVIGAGISGVLAAAKLRAMGLTRVRLIDRAGDVGGTWYWNRYPGAQCDVESYIYLPLLEETGYIPQEKYSFQPEIYGHLQRVTRQYGLYDLACFQTGVSGLQWDTDESEWIVSTDRRDRIRARFVVVANGPQNKPKLPGIAGIKSFKGHMFHTSRWDYAYTGGDNKGGLTGLADRRVGIIGTGATALQCVPHLAAAAKQLFVFQRTPSTVGVRNNRDTDPAWAESLSPGWQAERMLNFETVVGGGHVDEDLVRDGWTDLFTSLSVSLVPKEDGSEPAVDPEYADFLLMERIRNRVDEIVKDPATADALKPYYRVFCKRPGFHDQYLPAFNRPNVTLVNTDGRGVDRITERGVVVGEIEYELDCLVFATGFETGTILTHQVGYDIVGRHGATLSDTWANGMRTFHGLQAHGFPNCFFLGLTQTGVGANYTHTVAKQIEHLEYILGHVRTNGIATVEATADAEQQWVDTMNSKQAFREFWEACTPSRFNNEGNLDNAHNALNRIYGGGPLEFWRILSEWRDGEFRGLTFRTFDGDQQVSPRVQVDDLEAEESDPTGPRPPELT